ncbi:hypothetical protein GTH52_01990 [Clostridium tyrobutyricum]|uniref:Uncharacterized protein n=1 Tax=Clostridium tyrobutyricum DIVETGP TaxID=1408889 RepID=W6N665_CLOTY|nr:hypothetical protein [Clostridium tyrobutyricum]AND85377.1 hypothetical protein CTK_C21290 [Clostridium tyrobutyricum]ANP69925.1 hypothetical protein BA182_09610 [Clostridium tyrobutyricum]MBV4433979.1 hypothetical protein [Clostridium tyrobutyricum]QNB65713.1 hypothetical protein GTH52_01990 [Clostridium tyrobutyricum]CDL91650.1 hypothetical protein CTDIVETGP_1720 [Clostridium tyrobutyricum DIVETGP]
MNQLKDRYPDFYSLQDYLEYQKHINKSLKSKKLVEYLIDKIIDRQEIECMIQMRGDKAIILFIFLLLNKVWLKKVCKIKI